MTKTHVLKRALARRERDELFAAAAITLAGGKSIVFHAQVVDAAWHPVPDTGLELVISAATTDDAYNAWEHHAEDVGAVGVHQVMLTYLRAATEEEPAVELEVIRRVDLDMLALCDELGDLHDEDVRLGLAIPHAF